jgi:hypothetical protein
MGFDEPRHNRPPLEVELDVGVRQPALHVFVAANRDDLVVLDHECGGPPFVRIHREDVPVGPDLKSRWRRVQAHPCDPAADDDEKQQHDERPGGSLDGYPHSRLCKTDDTWDPH